MCKTKRWMLAGGVAGLLVASQARAGGPADDGRPAGGSGGPVARTVLVTMDGGGPKSGHVAAGEGEPVRLVLTVRSTEGGIDFSVRELGAADRAAAGDAGEIAAGNSGGRG